MDSVPSDIAIDALAERLRAALAHVKQGERAYRWFRRAVNDPRVPCSAITAALRTLDPPWLPSPMRRRNGSPRYWFRDDPAVDTIRARIEARHARLQEQHQPTAAPRAELQRELDSLGPYLLGEKRKVSLRCAALKKALQLPRGKFGTGELAPPLPATEAEIMAELTALGSWAWGESAYISRRRARLERELGIYRGKHGVNRTPLEAMPLRDP